MENNLPKGIERVKELYKLQLDGTKAILKAAGAQLYLTQKHIETAYNIKQIYDKPFKEAQDIIEEAHKKVESLLNLCTEDVYLQAIIDAAKKEEEDFFTCGGLFGFTKVPIP